MKRIFLINRFIGGRLTSKLDRKIRRFIGQHHQSHCIAIFGKNFKHVHDEMDKLTRKKPGKKHRIYGHNIDFIKEKFNGNRKDLSAAHIHLLGDFIADYLPLVFNNVLKKIWKDNINPPSYLSLDKEPYPWDVKKEVIDKLIQVWSESLISTLTARNRINYE